MEFYESLQKRRSTRKYQELIIPEDVLQRVFEAARRAPSWANSQAVRWVVVRDWKTKSRLAATLSPGNPSTEAITKAPVVLALCYIRNRSGFYKGKPSTPLGDWGMFDAGLAAANLTLAAAAEGLGTVHVGAIDIAAAARELNVPDDVQLVELIPLGYPAQEPTPTNRLDLAKIMFADEYRRNE
jgi:nitroreductase